MARGELTQKELEALFDVQGMTEIERAVWGMQHTGIPAGRMGYRTRTILSGDILEMETFPIFGRQYEKRTRAARARITPERMERANQAAAMRRIVRLANCNFTDRDIHLTLTYGEGQVPSYEQAQRDVKNFLRRVQRLREKRGLEKAGYIYVIEDNESGMKKRIHAHMLLSGGLSREELEACWRKGWANADRLQPNEEGLAAIAKYITKAQKNRKKWVCSRGLKQPKIRTSDTKLTQRRVERIAEELPAVWREELRRIYRGKWEPVSCDVYRSDSMPGVFVRAQMVRTKKAERRTVTSSGVTSSALRAPFPEGEGLVSARKEGEED